jgi:biotin transport system substrate-specific component
MQTTSTTLLNRALPLTGSQALLRDALIALAATVLLTLSAKVQIPFYPVPMTMQALVVLLIGAAFGWRLGAATLALYLLQGAVGLPVFAGTPAKGLGLAYMVGTTGGYLAGFFVAAAVTGYLAEKGMTRTVLGALGTMTLGMLIIHALGFAWLACLIGANTAFVAGVVPFVLGDLLKIALGAALLPAAWWLVGRLRG